MDDVQTTSEQTASAIGQHTPGPWTTDQESTNAIEIRDSDGNEIAGLICDDEPSEEMWTNARLIAAAPDMLDALNLVIELELLDSMPDDHEAAIQIRAAIAKATGTNPGDR